MDESVYGRISLWPNRFESEQLCRSNHLMTDVFDSWPWNANSRWARSQQPLTHFQHPDHLKRDYT